EQAYQQAKAGMQRGAEIYAVAEPDIRRQLNQAFCAVIEVDVDEGEVILGELWDSLSHAATYLPGEGASGQSEGSGRATRSKVAGSVKRRPNANSGPLLEVRSLRMNPLVEPRGLEPLTPTLPV